MSTPSYPATTLSTYAFGANRTIASNASLGVFNLRDYGANLTSGSDCTTALQATINAASANGGGTALIPPNFVCGVSAQITRPSNVWLVGGGPTSVVMQMPGSNLDWLIANAAYAFVNPATILAINYRPVTVNAQVYNVFDVTRPVQLTTGGGYANFTVNVNYAHQTSGLGRGILGNADGFLTVIDVQVLGNLGGGISLWDCQSPIVQAYSPGPVGNRMVSIHRGCYDYTIEQSFAYGALMAPFVAQNEVFTIPGGPTFTLCPFYGKFIDIHQYTATSVTAAIDLLGVANVSLTGVSSDGSGNFNAATRNTIPTNGITFDTGASSGVTTVSASAPLASSGGSTPNISLTGTVAAANGGTGLTSPGTATNVLTSTGTGWVSSPAVGGTTGVTAPITNTGTGTNPVIGLTSPLPYNYGGTGLAAAGASGNVLTSNGSTWTSAAPSGGASYSSVVLADSPSVYYHFAESSGTTATDSSGNGHNGTYVGTVIYGCSSLVHGAGDYSVGLNGAQYATCPVTPTGSFTVEAVVLATNTNPFGRIFGTDIYSSSTGFLFNLLQNPATMPPTGFGIVFNTTGSSLANVMVTTGLIYTNSRMHVALTYDGTTVKVYINGGLAYSATLSGTYKPSATYNVVAIGSDPSGSDSLSGFMDEFALYPTALTQARIQAHVAAASI